MTYFNTLVRWIVRSSANPQNESLTIKGFLLSLVPFAIAALGLTHVSVGADQLNALIDGVAAVLQAVLTAISAAALFVGLLRKFWLTIKAHQQIAQ